MTLRSLIIASTTLALFAGCGSEAPDIHAAPRDTKSYESAPVETMDPGALLAHLKLLAGEMSTATQDGAFVELHHIEIALTKALNALEPSAPSQAKPTIDTLKILAAKIHAAGHDQNETIAAKLDKSLTEYINRLDAAISVQP